MVHGAHLAHVDVDAVRSDDLGFEDALLFHIWHNGHALFVAHGFHFERGFGNVDVQRDVVLFGNIGAGAQDLGRGGVRRVRRNGGDDERMPLPFFDEFARVRNRIFVCRRVRRGIFHDGLPAHSAHARLGGGLCDVVFEEIHVVEGCHAAADLFCAGDERAEAHEFR